MLTINIYVMHKMFVVFLTMFARFYTICHINISGNEFICMFLLGNVFPGSVSLSLSADYKTWLWDAHFLVLKLATIVSVKMLTIQRIRITSFASYKKHHTTWTPPSTFRAYQNRIGLKMSS